MKTVMGNINFSAAIALSLAVAVTYGAQAATLRVGAAGENVSTLDPTRAYLPTSRGRVTKTTGEPRLP